MMSDDDDFEYTVSNTSKNLATLFHGEPAPTTPAATTAYVPPKQPKKDSPPRVMIASVVQAFSFGADQKWTPKGKMGVALLSTDNTIFQLIVYLTKTQHVTSARINTSSVFTPQSTNYLSFQDDGGQNWSIMFETKQAIVDFALQMVLAKAYLFAFKFDHIIQDIKEGEGSPLVDHESVEVTVNIYKLLENGTLQSADSGENKPVRFKVGKQQNGKAFDDVLRGMKKSGQRIAIIGTTLYSIEVVRIKREKEARTSSTTTAPVEEHPPVEQKRAVVEDNDGKDQMLKRIGKMGGISMIPHQNQSSAFGAPHQPHYSDDDSINNEFIQHNIPPRSVQTPVPPVQFVQPGYHHPFHPQPLIQQPNMYPPQQQQPLHDYSNRPGSSMAGMGYQQVSMWPQQQYPPPTPNMPPTDMFYQQQQQQFQPDFRQLLTRLTEKVDILNENLDTKKYPNMETSILLTNIQRIVKENETVKKDLFDRSAKVEELNSKISELLGRNQQLIEQSHHTVEKGHAFANNFSEQTAQKILDLEKQKLELTNNLSVATSKISDLQLQLNHYTQDTNENQSRLTSLTQKYQQYKDDLEKSENQRAEIQLKFDSMQEQLKNEKNTRKQLKTHVTTLEEELAEIKITCANLEKGNNERRIKYENERKRWQDDLEEQKQSYENELDELRTKLRKQRTVDNLTSTQEISRLEEDLEKGWKDKFERQQIQHERLLTSKGKELEQMKTLLTENETKLQQVNEELEESKQQIAAYEERCEKLQERLSLMKEKLIEMNDEQSELINEEVKRAINIIFQRLKTRIQPTKQYTGEEFLSRSLEIIKKATLKVLSNNEDDNQPSSDDIQSDNENEQIQTNDQPLNGNSIDQQTLNEEVSSVQTEIIKPLESETTTTTSSTTNNQRNGWDIVEDLPQEESKTQSESLEQNQVVLVTEQLTITVNETETITSNPVIENNEPILSSNTVEEGRDSDGTIEENEEKPPTALEESKENISSDGDEDNQSFQSARPSLQDLSPSPSVTQSAATPTVKSNRNIPLMTNLDDSDDELFK